MVMDEKQQQNLRTLSVNYASLRCPSGTVTVIEQFTLSQKCYKDDCTFKLIQ